MDYITAKTFLAICCSGTFGAAAKSMNVTQTTISARIKSLEDSLDSTLFIRNKSGATLTPSGEYFKSYAQKIVQTWDSARRDLALHDSGNNDIAIGVDLTLWNPIAATLLTLINNDYPQLTINVEVGDNKQLCEKVRSGRIDIALIHQPEYSSHTIVEHLLDEKLVRVQSKNKPLPYLFVNWGDEFQQLHEEALPDLAHSKIVTNLGPVALQFILKEGGSGYFRTRVINKHLISGKLELTPNSPEFSYPVYLLQHSKKNINIDKLKELLINVMEREDDWF